MNRAVRCYKEHSLSLEWRNERQIQTHTYTREHTHTHTHTPHQWVHLLQETLQHIGDWISSLCTLSMANFNCRPCLKTTWIATALLETGWIFLNMGCNVEGGDVFWGMCNPALLFWSALTKVLFKACPVPVGLKVRRFIDTPVRKGCLMNAGDCGKVSELGKWGKDMRY